MIRVLVAEDHPIVRDLLRRLLEPTGDIEIVAIERNGEKAVNQAILHRPDVAVIDVSMPVMDGVEATKEILLQSPETRVLILSGHNDHEQIKKSVEAGAFGYVLKEFMKEDLVLAVHALHEGHPYFSQSIAQIASRYMHREQGNTQN